MIRICSIFALLLAATGVFAQTDSLETILADSTLIMQSLEEDADSFAPPDSAAVDARSFDASTVEKLKNDPELQYDEVPTVAENLWTRFLMWLAEFVSSFFDSAVNTSWGRLLTYAVGIAIVVVTVMMLLKVNAFKVFYSAEGAESFKHSVLDENIHEMDFDKLISEALARDDYRLGVRLVFLYALKMLADKNMIHWDQGKTNHDYLAELKAIELKNGFNELNFYFEYAWYGNFKITENMFSHVQVIFNEWKSKIR